MKKNAEIWFEETVIPLVSEKLPEVASEMNVLVFGSFGLGTADEISDLDATIYLDDPLWKEQGAELQLLFETSFERFGADETYCCDICVHPLSWLREQRQFLETRAEARAELPWEKLTLEQFHDIQNCLILRDPHRIFHKLREATTPERFPGWLWKKLLIAGLKEVVENLDDCDREVRRGKTLEASIILGSVLEDLLHLGFVIVKEYHPWRKHLRWGFEKLPEPAPDVLPHVDAAVSSANMHEKLASLQAVRDIYTKYIAENDILPEVNVLAKGVELTAELTWAERVKAWSNPKWRDWITGCEKHAAEAGYRDHWWIWSLWGWDWHKKAAQNQ